VLEEEGYCDVQQLGSHEKSQSDQNPFFNLWIIFKNKFKNLLFFNSLNCNKGLFFVVTNDEVLTG
jgi:hypothetical protein